MSIELLRGKLYELALDCFADIDFNDLTDILNYRKAEFNNVGTDSESIERQCIVHEPGSYEPNEIKKYVRAIIQEAINRFLIEVDGELVEEFGEYFNHSSGLYAKVTKDSVEFDYIPIQTLAFED